MNNRIVKFTLFIQTLTLKPFALFFILLSTIILGGCPASTDTDNSSVNSLPLSQTSAVGSKAVEVVGHPDPLSLLTSSDSKLAYNKRLAFDFWRTVVNAGHVEAADEMLTEGYIQHSPVLPTGREAFKEIFSVVPRRDIIPELVEPPLVAIIAEGNLVAMTLAETLPRPDNKGTYTTTHFNLFRIKDGRLAEHWHSVQTPPGPDVPLPEDGGPQLVTGATGFEQFALLQASNIDLSNNKRLVFDVWRQIVDAGREELADLYLDEGYIQHNPNAMTGREGFKAYFSTRDDLSIDITLRDPLVAMLAEGELVVQAIMYEYPHPSIAARTYTTTWFDMFRVVDGRLVEHWDPATMASD